MYHKVAWFFPITIYLTHTFVAICVADGSLKSDRVFVLSKNSPKKETFPTKSPRRHLKGPKLQERIGFLIRNLPRRCELGEN